MSVLRISTLRTTPARSSTALRSIGSQRSFHNCRVLAVSKESALHTERSGEEVEAAKQAQLKDQKEGRGVWKDSLSSDSESIVKADRGEIKDSKATIKELQDETAKVAEQEKKGQ